MSDINENTDVREEIIKLVFEATAMAYENGVKSASEQLATAQLEIKNLREALNKIEIDYGCHDLVNAALATPTTTQHLQDYVELKIAERLGEPVEYQRFAQSGHLGEGAIFEKWLPIDGADIPHYKNKGQPIRALYAPKKVSE